MNSSNGVSVDKFIYFSSGGKVPYDKLSNFSKCLIEFPEGSGIVYPSSEHAFQAQLIPEAQRKRVFSVDGLFGKLEQGYCLYYTQMGNKEFTEKIQETISKKTKYWGERSGKLEKIGIIAKLVSKKDWMKQHLNIDKIDIGGEKCYEIFKQILMVKYKNPIFRTVLLETENVHLIEFDRMAKKRSDAGTPPRWSGMVVDNIIHGHNQMGGILMDVRTDLKK